MSINPKVSASNFKQWVSNNITTSASKKLDMLNQDQLELKHSTPPSCHEQVLPIEKSSFKSFGHKPSGQIVPYDESKTSAASSIDGRNTEALITNKTIQEFRKCVNEAFYPK
jgi:hypothetical protein